MAKNVAVDTLWSGLRHFPITIATQDVLEINQKLVEAVLVVALTIKGLRRTNSTLAFFQKIRFQISKIKLMEIKKALAQRKKVLMIKKATQTK